MKPETDDVDDAGDIVDDIEREQPARRRPRRTRMANARSDGGGASERSKANGRTSAAAPAIVLGGILATAAVVVRIATGSLFSGSAWLEGALTTGRSPPPSVLGATEFSCTDEDTMRNLFARAEAVCTAHPGFRLSVNVFDATPGTSFSRTEGGSLALRCASDRPPLLLPSCTVRELCSRVRGMKALYWKKTLPPRVTDAYRFVWIFDNDIGIDELDLEWFTDVMRRKDVPMMQPRFVYPNRPRAGGDFPRLTWPPRRDLPDGCDAISTDYLEPQMPMMTSPAWAYFHSHLLSAVPERALFETDYGVPDTWCRVVQAGRANDWRPPSREQKCLTNEEYVARPACAIATVGVSNFDANTIVNVGNSLVTGKLGGYWLKQYKEVIFPGCGSDWGEGYVERCL